MGKNIKTIKSDKNTSYKPYGRQFLTFVAKKKKIPLGLETKQLLGNVYDVLSSSDGKTRMDIFRNETL